VATDWAHVFTRTSGQAGSGFQLSSGVEFVVKPSELEVRANGASLATAVFDGGLGVGQPTVFDVFDDGARVSLTVRTKGALNETRLAVSFDGGVLAGGKVAFGSGNDTTPVNGNSGFGLLRIEHGLRVKPTREWTFEEVSPGPTGTVVGGFGALPDGGLSGSRTARFVTNVALNAQAPSAVAPGIFGAAASFAASPVPGRFVEFPNDIIGSTGGDFSVSFWSRTGPFNGNFAVEVFGNRNEGSNGVFLSIRSTPRAISSELDQNGDPRYSAVSSPLATSTDDLWHHVVVTREGLRQQIFVDGALAGANDAGVLANFGKSTPFWVGRGFSSLGTGNLRRAARVRRGRPQCVRGAAPRRAARGVVGLRRGAGALLAVGPRRGMCRSASRRRQLRNLWGGVLSARWRHCVVPRGLLWLRVSERFPRLQRRAR
jgi:hypothetical protein